MVSRMVITDIPVKIPGLGACVACAWQGSQCMEGHRWATEYLEHDYIDIAGPMPVVSAGGWEYIYFIIDDYTCTVYTRPLI